VFDAFLRYIVDLLILTLIKIHWGKVNSRNNSQDNNLHDGVNRMRRQKSTKLTAGLMGICFLLLAVPIWACSVPVFRYALERWVSDPYLVVVFHRGELTVEQQALVNRLGPKGERAENSANLKVRTVDLLDDTPDADMLELWKLQKSDTVPWMAVHYPAPFPPAWAGPFNKDVVDGLIDSPVRREIARRILKGNTAVWVFLESGNKKLDDAKFEILTARLKHEQETLQLPEIDPEDIANGLLLADEASLKVAFSALRLSRSDSQEKMFVDMLLGSEGGGELSLRADDVLGKPMAFPVFGRGRVLYGLVGDGINEDTIADACQLLIGPCTCQVKDDNPGIDLVMAVDWDALVESTVEIDKALPPLAGLGGFAASSTDSVASVTDASSIETSDPINESADNEPQSEGTPLSTLAAQNDPETGMSSVLRNTLLLGGLVLAGVFGATFFLTRNS
jgi:hypothetical protein